MPTPVFDANGTLFDLTPVGDALGSGDRQEAFFERLLQSALTLTVVGVWIPFDQLAGSVLATTCATLGLDEVDQEQVLASLKELPPYPDAEEALAASGRAAILTNSAAASTRALVGRGGLSVETVLSCEEVQAYKPTAAPYRLAADRLGDCVLVAAHAWDVVGARAAGLRAIWVRREEKEWPFRGLEPGESAQTLVEAVEQIDG
jgi:2-haloacid dehalogenase